MPEVPAPAPDRSVEAFLDAVDLHVIRLGVRDHIDVRMLLRSRESWPRDDLKASLGAMLARSREEVCRIGDLFDRHLAPPGGDREMPPDVTRVPEQAAPPPPARRRPLLDPRAWPARRVLAALGAGGLAAGSIATIGLALVVRVGSTSASPAGPSPAGATSSAAEGATAKPERGTTLSAQSPRRWKRQRIAEPRAETQMRTIQRRWDFPDILALLATWLLLYLALRWWLLPGAFANEQRTAVDARRQLARERRRDLAARLAASGEPLRLSYRVPQYPGIPEAALDDAATLLGRLFRQERGDALDVDRTIAETLREGGRFVPVLEARRGARELLILVDEERGDHPWLGGIERALDHLERANVRLLRYRFSLSPESLKPARGGPPIKLQELARRCGEEPLLIISRSISPRAREGAAEWPEELAAFPLKAWLDPDPRPVGRRVARAAEVDALVRRGLARFPWTAEGVSALAGYLASEGELVAEPTWPALPSLDALRVLEAVEAWALCAALVPDASWDQLEAIRRHPDFTDIGAVLPAPCALQCLLDWVASRAKIDPESGDGRTLDLSPELVDDLVRNARRRCAGRPREQSLEARAHRLLIEQLGGERPGDELQRMRWDLKLASHRIVLEPEQTLALMGGFIGSAVEDEVTEILDAELRRQAEGDALGDARVPEADRERLRALAGDATLAPVRHLVWGGWRLTAIALAAATVIVTGLVMGVVKLEGANRALMGFELQTKAVFPETYELKPE